MATLNPSLDPRRHVAWSDLIRHVIETQGEKVWRDVIRNRVRQNPTHQPLAPLVVRSLKGSWTTFAKGKPWQLLGADTTQAIKAWNRLGFELLQASGFCTGMVVGTQLPQFDLRVEAQKAETDAVILHGAALWIVQAVLEWAQQVLWLVSVNPSLSPGQAWIPKSLSALLKAHQTGIVNGWTLRHTFAQRLFPNRNTLRNISAPSQTIQWIQSVITHTRK